MNRFARLSVLPVMLSLAACSQPPAEAEAPVRPVLTILATEANTTLPGFVGVVTPQESVVQSFRVGGTLTARNVNVGDSVRAGAVLASLDATTYQLTVQTARSNLSSAESQYANASGFEDRLRSLTQSDVVSQSNLEQAVQQTSAALAAVEQARSRVDQAEEQLSYTNLLAPFDGIVLSVGAEPGAVVAAGQTILTVAEPDARDLVIDVPESVISNIALGTVFTVVPQLAPDAAISGTVREIAPQANPVTRSWRVKIGLNEPPELFWIGTTASASLELSSGSALALPQSAIRRDGDKTGIWVVNVANATVSLREVTTGAVTGTSVLITSGLEAGERVVVAGVNRLSEGQKVKLDSEHSK